MHINYKWTLLVLPLLMLGSLRAETNTPPPPRPAPVLDDKFIDTQKEQLDKILQKRAEMMNKNPVQTQNPGTQFQKDRMEFDTKIMTERRAFLDTLKAMPQSSRTAAMKDFNLKQNKERNSFIQAHKQEMETLQKQMQNKIPPPVTK